MHKYLFLALTFVLNSTSAEQLPNLSGTYVGATGVLTIDAGGSIKGTENRPTLGRFTLVAKLSNLRGAKGVYTFMMHGLVTRPNGLLELVAGNHRVTISIQGGKRVADTTYWPFTYGYNGGTAIVTPNKPTGKLGEKSTTSDESSRSIGRNDDTRVTSQGRINAANASDQLLTTSGLPCTEYVANVVAASGIDINQQIPNRNYTIKDAININQKVLKVSTNEELDKRVLDDYWADPGAGVDRPTKGVVNALVAAKAGKEINMRDGPFYLQKGDLLQYWFLKDGQRLGHAAVVIEPFGGNGKITLGGSQNGIEKTFPTTLKSAQFIYAVRLFR